MGVSTPNPHIVQGPTVNYVFSLTAIDDSKAETRGCWSHPTSFYSVLGPLNTQLTLPGAHHSLASVSGWVPWISVPTWG